MTYLCYEGVHTARAFTQVARKSYESAKAYVKTSQNLYDQGLIVKSDLLLAKVNLAQAKLAIRKAENDEKNALDNLKTLLNLPLTETLTVKQREDLPLHSENIELLKTQAIANNHFLDTIRKNIVVKEKQLDIVKSDYYPSVNIYLRKDWHNESFNKFEASDFTFAGIATWKITDFGGTDSAVDRCNAMLNQEKSLLRSEINKVKLNIQNFYRNYIISKENEGIQKLAIDQAQEAQRLSQMQYENGMQTLPQLIASQALLNKARAELVKANYETNSQKAKLLVATGQLNQNIITQH